MQHFLTIAVVALVALGLLAMLLRPIAPKEPFEDKDRDGEPDERDGPAKDL